MFVHVTAFFNALFCQIKSEGGVQNMMAEEAEESLDIEGDSL